MLWQRVKREGSVRLSSVKKDRHRRNGDMGHHQGRKQYLPPRSTRPQSMREPLKKAPREGIGHDRLLVYAG